MEEQGKDTKKIQEFVMNGKKYTIDLDDLKTIMEHKKEAAKELAAYHNLPVFVFL